MRFLFPHDSNPMIYIYISAELTEYSPIINQIVVTHQAEKIWMYDHMTVQLTV